MGDIFLLFRIVSIVFSTAFHKASWSIYVPCLVENQFISYSLSNMATAPQVLPLVLDAQSTNSQSISINTLIAFITYFSKVGSHWVLKPIFNDLYSKIAIKSPFTVCSSRSVGSNHLKTFAPFLIRIFIILRNAVVFPVSPAPRTQIKFLFIFCLILFFLKITQKRASQSVIHRGLVQPYKRTNRDAPSRVLVLCAFA